MTKGRPPDPNRARRGTGNRALPGEKKAQEVAIVRTEEQQRSITTPPDDLSDGAKAIYQMVATELEGRGLRPSDLSAVRMLAITADRYNAVVAEVERTGLVILGNRGPTVNPLIKVERDLAATYLRLADALGVTPTARVRLGLMTLAGQSLVAQLNDDLTRGF